MKVKAERVNRKTPRSGQPGCTTLWIGLALLGVSLTAGAANVADVVEYLGDNPSLVSSSSQDWGELGWNQAAHLPDVPGTVLHIGKTTYSKGLGNHANGSVVVDLDGEYASFDAEVGLQPCGNPGGSVIFRVFADDRERFDSGVMRVTNEAKPLHVDLAGVQQLRLEVRDAGDGINCDMANWANARLTRAQGVSRRHSAASTEAVDIAPFGRVVTWDPNRLDGARASRIEEFRAEDLFLEQELPRQPQGYYKAPVYSNGLACIGLQWLNRRVLRELRLEFAQGAAMPPLSEIQVQTWVGESAWQGKWEALVLEPELAGRVLIFRFPARAHSPTQKVRWIFPAPAPIDVRSVFAYTRSRWQTTNVVFQIEEPRRGARGRVRIWNGEFAVSGLTGGGHAPEHSGAKWQSRTIDWKLEQPLHLTIRYSRPSSFKSDPTVLQFQLPTGAFGVASEDVLSNDCVYLPEHGLFVAREPAPITLADYRRKIAAQKTVLQQVRELPDQTIEQAMVKTHHDAQREGPVMLSLACDNNKFVVDRDGTLHFQATTNLTRDWFETAGELRPKFGSGATATLNRRLEGGWSPMPVMTAEDRGMVYSERVFVAPTDLPASDPARLNRPFVCVVEFFLTNSLDAEATGKLTLDFLAETRHKRRAGSVQPIEVPPGVGLQKSSAALPSKPSAWRVTLGNSNLRAVLVSAVPSTCAVDMSDGAFSLSGTLAAHVGAAISVYLFDERTDITSVLSKPSELHEAFVAYWNAVLAPAMQVETPDLLLNNLIRSSQVRCLIAARNEADGARVAPWIAAMSYGPLESEGHSVIRGMQFMGHAEFARRALDFFIHRYNTNGFLTTGYTTFGTAWHLWALSEYYQLERDTNWLKKVAPELIRVGDWVVRQTDKTRGASATTTAANGDIVESVPAGARPEAGLMPPGVLADWNAFAYHFAMDAYYYAGLRGLGEALLALGNSAKGELYLEKAKELRTRTVAAYHWTQAQSPALKLGNGAWIPHYPSQVHSPGKLADFFPGQDAGRSWCYDVELGAHQLVPTGVFPPNDREVSQMLEHMEDVQFLADGWFDYPSALNHQDWFNLGGFSKVQPFYTRNCEIYALRDEVKPFIRSYFNTFAAMLNPEVMTFWEHFHHSGAWDKTHETGYFQHQTRTMLVTERGNDLWLAPLVTTNWLTDGKTLAVSNAPTRFGSVSYRIESRVAEGRIVTTILPPTRTPPHEVVLRFRHPEQKQIRSVFVNGKKCSQFDGRTGIVRLRPAARKLEVEVRY